MPRYFFNSEDGEVLSDNEGEQLADDMAAKREAVKLMGSIMRDSPDDFLDQLRWRLIVADAERGDLFTIEISMEVGSAISDWGHPMARTPSA